MVGLYLRWISFSLRSQLQYRGSVALQAAANFLATVVEFGAIAALFERLGALPGWSLAEVALLYGMINVSFALAEAFARGFDVFPTMVRSGDFDRVLLRPRDAAFQVAAQEVQLMRMGRLLQGAVVLLFALRAVEVAWDPLRLALLVLAIAGGACTFAGLFVFQAAMAFYTVETLEVVNVVTYGGTETAQFPIAIYRPWFRHFFTFVVPLACANYLPAHAILGRPDALGSPPLVQWCAPLVGVAFLVVSLSAFRLGTRRYLSTGS